VRKINWERRGTKLFINKRNILPSVCLSALLITTPCKNITEFDERFRKRERERERELTVFQISRQ